LYPAARSDIYPAAPYSKETPKMEFQPGAIANAVEVLRKRIQHPRVVEARQDPDRFPHAGNYALGCAPRVTKRRRGYLAEADRRRTRPATSRTRARLQGVHLVAVIQQNGKVEFAGEQYDSLSTAAGMARKTVIGSPPGRP